MFELAMEIQYVIFVKSIGLGFAEGVLYDILQAFSFGRRIPKIILTVLFFLFCAVLSFSFCLEFNFGKGRMYIFAGEIIGAALYFFYPSAVVKRISLPVSKKMKEILYKKSKNNSENN